MKQLLQLLATNARVDKAPAIRAEAGKVYIYDVIDRDWGASAKALIDALAPYAGQPVALQDIPGQAPAMNRLGTGCSFAGRCSVSLPACQLQAPPWLGTATHARLCHLEGQP